MYKLSSFPNRTVIYNRPKALLNLEEVRTAQFTRLKLRELATSFEILLPALRSSPDLLNLKDAGVRPAIYPQLQSSRQANHHINAIMAPKSMLSPTSKRPGIRRLSSMTATANDVSSGGVIVVPERFVLPQSSKTHFCTAIAVEFETFATPEHNEIWLTL